MESEFSGVSSEDLMKAAINMNKYIAAIALRDQWGEEGREQLYKSSQGFFVISAKEGKNSIYQYQNDPRISPALASGLVHLDITNEKIPIEVFTPVDIASPQVKETSHGKFMQIKNDQARVSAAANVLQNILTANHIGVFAVSH